MSSVAPRMTPGLLAALGFSAAVGPFATDMYLASFASIQRDLGTTASQVQVTLTVFFLGIGAGQLILGAVSDRLGRRRVLLTALTVFTISGAAMVVTPSIEILLALRLVQGLSGAAGVVIARAVAADLSEGPTAVRALSLIAMVSSLGPLVAPVIGGFTHEWWGWRGTLATLATVSLAMLVVAWWRIPESLPRDRRLRGGLLRIVTPFGRLLTNPRYVAYLVTFVFGFTAIIAYISASPFVAQAVLAMSPLGFSLGFATSATGLILASLTNAHVAPRIGPPRALTISLTILLAGGLGMLLLTLMNVLSVWSFIVAAFVVSVGASGTMANASALALAEASFARGSGAALLGSLQFVAGGLTAPIVGAWGESTALPMAVILVAAGTVASVAAAIGARQPTRSAIAREVR